MLITKPEASVLDPQNELVIIYHHRFCSLNSQMFEMRNKQNRRIQPVKEGRKEIYF